MNPSEQTSPKLFVSHTNSDKPKAERLARDLRSHSVDVWLDLWEVRPGDSLREKIFEQGIKEASIFAIMLSPEALASNWVKAELDAAHALKIARGLRIVPVLLDAESDIPPDLKSLRWLHDDEHLVEELVAIAFGRDVRSKPPLGPAPRRPAFKVARLTPDAAMVAEHLAKTLDDPDAELRECEWDDLKSTLEFTGQRLIEAIEELAELRAVYTNGASEAELGVSGISPTNKLAELLDGSGVVSFSVSADALELAIAAVAKRSLDHGYVNLGDIRGTLSAARLNFAVDYLQDRGLAEFNLYATGRAVYDGSIRVTQRTRSFVSDRTA